MELKEKTWEGIDLNLFDIILDGIERIQNLQLKIYKKLD